MNNIYLKEGIIINFYLTSNDLIKNLPQKFVTIHVK